MHFNDDQDRESTSEQPLVFVDENGVKHQCFEAARIEVEDQEYAVFLPIEEFEDVEFIAFMRVERDLNGEERLEEIEDDQEYEMVETIWDEYQEEQEEEDEEEEEGHWEP